MLWTAIPLNFLTVGFWHDFVFASLCHSSTFVLFLAWSTISVSPDNRNGQPNPMITTNSQYRLLGLLGSLHHIICQNWHYNQSDKGDAGMIEQKISFMHRSIVQYVEFGAAAWLLGRRCTSWSCWMANGQQQQLVERIEICFTGPSIQRWWMALHK